MENYKKILYIGAWHDITPLLDFKNADEFIFIDTQPRSEFDGGYKFERKFYRKNFIESLHKTLTDIHFELINTKTIDEMYYKKIMTDSQIKQGIPEYINPTLLTFENKTTNQILKYYVSTNIKYNISDQLISDIRTSDTLVISGHHPDKLYLNYFDKPKLMIAYSGTYYGMEGYNEEPDNMLYYLHKYPHLEHKYLKGGFYMETKKEYYSKKVSFDTPKYFSNLRELCEIYELDAKSYIIEENL